MSTEAAVLDGGAPAPAETSGAILPEAQVDVPNALGSQTPEKPEAVIEDKPSKTPGEAVRKAMEAVKAKEAAKEPAKEPAKAEAPKEEAKPAAERAPDGKFVAKQLDPNAAPAQPQATQQPAAKPEPGTIHEAPQRFDATAKAEWANAPEAVKGAVHRTIRELEAGIEEHRTRWEPIKQYDEMAKQYGTDLPAALERYVAMDKLLSQDLAAGLDSIIRDKTGGQIGLRELIGQLTGQQPDQAQSRSDNIIHELRQEIGSLRQQIGGVTGHIQQQAASASEQQVVAFSAGKPDFEALAPKIVEHIGKGLSLEQAYEQAKTEAQELARSLGFVPAGTVSEGAHTAVVPQPLKPAGQKSIHGAPATGSDPASTTRNAPVPSIRDALKRAAARV